MPAFSLPRAWDAGGVRNYAAYRLSEHAWALGRFIVPLARLEEFEQAPEDRRDWKLSVLGPPSPDLQSSVAKIDTIELKAVDVTGIEQALSSNAAGLTAVFEIRSPRTPPL